MKLGKKRAFFTLGLVPIFGYIGSKFGPQNSRKTTAPLPCRSISSLIMLMLSNMCNTMAGWIANPRNLLNNYHQVHFLQWINNRWFYGWLVGVLVKRRVQFYSYPGRYIMGRFVSGSFVQYLGLNILNVMNIVKQGNKWSRWDK